MSFHCFGLKDNIFFSMMHLLFFFKKYFSKALFCFMPLGSHLGGEAKSFKVRIKNWEYVSV